MGKRLIQQRRGGGNPRYRSPKSRYKVKLRYRRYDDLESTGMLKAQIMGFIDDPSREPLLMHVLYDNGEEGFLLAHEGAAVGDEIELGAQAKLAIGNVLPLYRIPEGSYVFNIEKIPGDGGRYARSSGSFAILVSKENGKAYLKLPSKKTISVPYDSRAQVGVVCGGGKKELPLTKAGTAFYKYKAKNKMWPKVRGVKMNPIDHPHGGKQHHAGRPTTVARGTPPGAKVGHIAASRTGRRRGRR